MRTLQLAPQGAQQFGFQLRRQWNRLAKEPELRISHTNERWIRNGNFVNAMDKHRKAGGDLFELSLPLCFISPSSVLMHRSLPDQYGRFDESLPVCEDYDLWLRIGCREKFHYLKQPLVTKFGGHEDQLSRRFWGMDRFRIQSLVKLLQQNPLSATQRLQAIQVLLQKAETYLQGARKRNRHDEVEQHQQLIAPFLAEWRSRQGESQSTFSEVC